MDVYAPPGADGVHRSLGQVFLERRTAPSGYLWNRISALGRRPYPSPSRTIPSISRRGEPAPSGQPVQLVGEGESVYPLDHFADFRPGLSRFEIAEQAFEHARGCAGGGDELDDAPSSRRLRYSARQRSASLASMRTIPSPATAARARSR